MANPNNNPLLCDPEKGICEIPASQTDMQNNYTSQNQKPITIIYFTDPICSSCWGIEPQLRKLKLEYGSTVEIQYHMGGLLPDWSYNSGGISKPSDVAQHWDEVSAYYQMPIDGDVWLEDPLSSSYPPSIAFKAAQMQDAAKAIPFLRRIREMVFLEKKNITKWEHIASVANEVKLDPVRLKADYENQAIIAFQADLELAKKMGVRGFPSLFVTNNKDKQEFIYGFKPYSVFENSIVNIYPEAKKINYDKSWKYLFEKYPTLTLKEFSELSEMDLLQSETTLQKLLQQKELTRLTTKNGALWKINEQ